ncbi:MAG: hypothetical protein NWF05_08625 [Candidatus Bathyarchaeota archaeon]|nr:hypothetical protein [Candidatus Bathyarchaeota archaeon]
MKEKLIFYCVLFAFRFPKEKIGGSRLKVGRGVEKLFWGMRGLGDYPRLRQRLTRQTLMQRLMASGHKIQFSK